MRNAYPVPRQPVGLPGPQIVAPTFATIPAVIGAWTWRGVAAVVTAVGINAAVGSWTWKGNSSPLGSVVTAKVGSYTWSGKSSPLSASISSKVGPYTWSGAPATFGTIPTPTPTTGSGGGGRYFGYYPERAEEVRAEIRALTKEKKRIERRFKLAPNNVDLVRLATLLTELQQRLNALIAEYEELIHVWQAEALSAKAQEEDEEFLVSLFSESFYNG